MSRRNESTGSKRLGAALDSSRILPDVERLARTTDGVEIRYDVAGEGAPTLVFVHGWSCDRAYWQAQMAAFAATNQVVAIDLAGHGASGADRADWTMAAYGNDVAAVAAEMHLDDMVLIGHSMGGDVIVEAAHVLRNRVRGLVWVDTYGRVGPPQTPEQLEAILAPLRNDFAGRCNRLVRGMFLGDADPKLVARVASDMAAAPPAVALPSVANSLANEARIAERLDGLGLPCFAINSGYIKTDVASLAEHGVTTRVIDGLGHFPMLEDPARFNAVLREVLAEMTSLKADARDSTRALRGSA